MPAERLISIDQILDSRTTTHDLMCELICRIAIGAVLEDLRYQGAISKLAVHHGMVGRTRHCVAQNDEGNSPERAHSPK